MTVKPFAHKYAYSNLKTNFMFHEDLAKVFFKLINKNGIIITHRSKNVKEKYSKNFRILEEKTYGISKISFGNLN